MKTKLFPRNLTARAAHTIEANPVTSRPESGTDVCTPGLEIDLRALEERFFPGFVWEFERPPEQGAKVVDMLPVVQGLRREECIGRNRGGYIWAILGRIHRDDAEPRFFAFDNAAGRTVWRRVRDLAKGRVAILIGPTPKNEGISRKDAQKLLAEVLASREPKIVREDRKLVYAAMAADRREYIDRETGVIVDDYAPGELTKGLCSPWQFDFRDCGCAYWAAAKPDMVRSPDPDVRYLNYNRNRRLHANEPDTPVLADRKAAMYSEEAMVSGAWLDFPTVIGDVERDTQPAVIELMPAGQLFDRKHTANELGYLATVEHALLIEYLYSAYTVNAAFSRASQAVRAIAIDEMRHFLWVNELLQILNYYPSTGRAHVLGADPRRAITERHCRQPIDIGYMHKAFQLCPLTLPTVDYYIDVEKNSRTINGMYSHLYSSVLGRPDEFPEHRRLLPILKLIIDEGEDHYERLVNVRKTLEGHKAGEWLLKLGAPKKREQKQLYSLAERYYHLLLHIISTSFRLDNGGPLLLTMAKDLMRELDETIAALASMGVAFEWPAPQRRDDTGLNAAMQEMEERVENINALKPAHASKFLRIRSEAVAAIRLEIEGKGEVQRETCCLDEYEVPGLREC